MPNFFTAHTPDFSGEEKVLFPEIGDTLDNGSNIEHVTINYFGGAYSPEAKKALRKVCAFMSPFEVHTEKPILVGPNEDLLAAAIRVAPELLALHALSISAVEHADPTVHADRTWALHKYNPHMTDKIRLKGEMYDKL